MYRNHSIYAATNENSRRLAKSIRFEKLQLSKEKEEADYIRRIGLVADLEKQYNLPLPWWLPEFTEPQIRTFLMKELKYKELHVAATKIQSAWRSYIQRMHFI